MGIFTGSVREVGDARPLDVVILDAAGNPITTFAGPLAGNSSTITSVATSTTSTLLLSANPDRKKFMIYNNSKKTLLVAFANTVAANAMSFPVPSQGVYESHVNEYVGDVAGVWVGADGSGVAHVTEIV